MFSKIKAKIKKNWQHIVPPPEVKRGKPWNAIDGDLTLRLNYDELNEKSIVFDLGGFKGQFAGDIFAKYQCTIFVFEPVQKFYEIIKNRYKKNNAIQIFPFGLGGKSEKLTIHLEGDKTSLYKKNEQEETIEIRCFNDFLKEHTIEKIDLLKINIEGAEYDVLEHIIEVGAINKIKNIQVQFHDFVPNAKDRMLQIQQKLAHTHKQTYSFEFVWENWQLMHH